MRTSGEGRAFLFPRKDDKIEFWWFRALMRKSLTIGTFPHAYIGRIRASVAIRAIVRTISRDLRDFPRR
jgi:hypothetical protein